jgi:ABC-type phosphate transport system substrate-binding protein
VFTVFSDAAEKTAYFSAAGSDILTTAFANIPVVMIYHLSAYTAKTAVPLQLTADVIAGILMGTISYWDDAAIKGANAGTSSYLPHTLIKFVGRSTVSDTTGVLLK